MSAGEGDDEFTPEQRRLLEESDARFDALLEKHGIEEDTEAYEEPVTTMRVSATELLRGQDQGGSKRHNGFAARLASRLRDRLRKRRL